MRGRAGEGVFCRALLEFANSIQQEVLAELISKGATVIICPMCMKHYGVQESDLLPGLQIGAPEVTGGALFKGNTKTLTW